MSCSSVPFISQKNSMNDTPVLRHLAIIMDGNGRWARARHLPRFAGHHAGLESVRRVVRAALTRGIDFLTLYSFSTENWTRPAEEVNELMGLLRRFIRSDLATLHAQNIKIIIIGSREELSEDIRLLFEETEEKTRDNTGLSLVIAFNYGARQEILRAVRRLISDVIEGKISPDALNIAQMDAMLDTSGIPDPDLVIRTSGEQRLSNFLLWQSAYSEFYFTPILWPDFDEPALDAAIEAYKTRSRRYGGL